MITTADELHGAIGAAVEQCPVTDIHTHLYDPAFGDMLLWGADELITYHYLIAEAFRRLDMPYDAFFSLNRREQADLIFKTLFIESTPVSEACRGVLTSAAALGYPLTGRTLEPLREYVAAHNTRSFIDTVFGIARVRRVVMTNDPLDAEERGYWMAGPERDARFTAALRIDPILLNWYNAVPQLEGMGYAAREADGSIDTGEVRRFLLDWARHMGAVYMAVSLPGGMYDSGSVTDTLINGAVLPACRELGIPFALMIGVRRQQNSGLRLAGDGVQPADLARLSALCRDNPRNKFMATLLSRENQHELAVMARKFRNLLVFGCWWFLNNPSLIEETTLMRMELLGTAFVPQHSDARVLDQLIYKWEHSRRVIAGVMQKKYGALLEAGWAFDEADIRRDVHEMLGGGNFDSFVELAL